MLYKNILKPIAFMFDPEFVHDRFVVLGGFLGRFSVTRAITQKIYGYNGPDISKVVDGITYRTPFLLSAGFDYNGRLTQILPYVGFGGVEIGSVTAKKCRGNEKPRLLRLPKSKSIVVNKGLRNDGVDAIIERLKNAGVGSRTSDAEVDPRKHGPTIRGVIGVSIARTNDVSCVDTKSGIDDYVYSFKRLNEENVGDYYTLNISCPNSFGGESFADAVLLERLMVEIDKIECKKPIYVKMPITIEWQKFDAVLQVLSKHRVNGVIIGNLNKDYASVAGDPDVPKQYSGGLSGEPCRVPSNELIRKTRFNYGKRFTIIGCGGVMSSEHAQEKFDAGADLVQLITGMIYEGPGLIRKLCGAYSSFQIQKDY